MKLTREQTEYLGDSIGDAAAIVERCLDLLKSHGYVAKSAWTDPSLTSTSAQHCLQIIIGEANRFGYGENQRLAAIDSFTRLWFYLITVPNAPNPSEEEIALKESGRLFSAIVSYADRTGETTRVAQLQLRAPKAASDAHGR